MSQTLVRIFRVEDGVLVECEVGSDLVLDHCFLYGDGVFEGIRVYQSKCLLLDAHLTRLERSAALVGIDVPSVQSVADALGNAIGAASFSVDYLRVIATRGTGGLGIKTNTNNQLLVVIAASLQLFESPTIRALVASTPKPRREVLDGSIKSCNYLINVQATREAATSANRRHDSMTRQLSPARPLSRRSTTECVTVPARSITNGCPLPPRRIRCFSVDGACA